jgi:predicted nucleic acid-binding protein
MTAVIDVSGAMTILLQKEKTEKYQKVLQESTLVIAPDLFVSELTNTFLKYFKTKIFTKEQCIQYIFDGIDYVDIFFNTKDIWQEAFFEGINNNHSIYDMFYLVIAKRHSGILITNDSVLAEICKKNKIPVCY